MDSEFTRRHFIKTIGTTAAAAVLGGLPATLLAGEVRLVKYPEKTELIRLTSRPPQLETRSVISSRQSRRTRPFLCAGTWPISRLPSTSTPGG